MWHFVAFCGILRHFVHFEAIRNKLAIRFRRRTKYLGGPKPFRPLFWSVENNRCQNWGVVAPFPTLKLFFLFFLDKGSSLLSWKKPENMFSGGKGGRGPPFSINVIFTNLKRGRGFLATPKYLVLHKDLSPISNHLRHLAAFSDHLQPFVAFYFPHTKQIDY